MTAQPQPDPNATPQPTVQEVTSVAQAGGEAAGPAIERGATPEEVRAIVRDAMAERARTEKVNLSDEHIQSIAHATIAQLEAAGAFEPPAPPPAGGAAPAAAESAAPAAATPAPEGAPPKRTTFADKFFGQQPR